jgi:hypothetical protein
MESPSDACDFNEIRREGPSSGAGNALLWWHPGPGFLDVVENEVAFAGFKRFGRGSFGPRSKA